MSTHGRWFLQVLVSHSGGVGIFINCASQCLHHIERILHEFTDCVVLLFKSSQLSYLEDIILYFTYVSPEGSSTYDNLKGKMEL